MYNKYGYITVSLILYIIVIGWRYTTILYCMEEQTRCYEAPLTQRGSRGLSEQGTVTLTYYNVIYGTYMY